MKTIFAVAIASFLFSLNVVSAQEKFAPNQTVAKKIEPSKTEVFSMALNDGDFTNVSLGYKGKLNFFLLNPDGTIARRLIGTSGDASISRREHLKPTQMVRVATFWRRRAICAMCCWLKVTKSTISNSPAAMTV